jgi:hypothetical protein
MNAASRTDMHAGLQHGESGFRSVMQRNIKAGSHQKNIGIISMSLGSDNSTTMDTHSAFRLNIEQTVHYGRNHRCPFIGDVQRSFWKVRA